MQDRGFIVLEYNDGKWLRAADSFFDKIKMTESQSSLLIIENQVIDISETTNPEPHILILSSGEMTPFILTFSAPQTEQVYQITATLLGHLELE